ncbi:TRAP transporter substrate-binding protein [Pseudomonas chlororaphis]|uniref:TRAP transporter substrate-binding protein n=1 Tax=Pseudomonas chlororaphis TaxID=587753 RepID=UPI0006A5893F|nr:TRAP transporter substrate-binding protein [Pseudomonas chlororaphis]AZD01934.1 TRAP-type C4-dicarboxylate transport system, periplasmic component [Pseudomonas chlororaphis subsp. chlororaphis]MBM0283115.1 TRAP transporter substrate-binding protein [Pseudomonas chlororaphis]MDO1507156.1 TRAP transporter substrate-binding protein [Pseudomonas chlororaphis]ORM45083.1 C4-dicarboxylate ABC transporter substrate-binding protein [Pseudomonas chlororaphis subsp. chlororaphis]TWR98567.1 TRAP transp
MPLTRRRFVQCAALSACALALPSIARAAPLVLRLSSTMTADENSAHYLFYQRLAENLKQSVGDRIRIDFFPNGQLGKEADVVQQVRLGSIDLMVSGSSIWATALPELALLDLGFLFDSYEHVARSVDGGVGEIYNGLLRERTGCSVVGWGAHFSARSVYTKPPIKDLESIRNTKLRVLPTQAFIETFKLLGAIPTPIAFNEVYTAIQTGVVEGFEHDAASVLANKLDEVVSHSWQTDHLFSPCIAVIGKRGLAKIPADLQPVFMAAAREASVSQRRAAAIKGAEAIAALGKGGMTFFPMADAERASIRTLMRDKLWLPFTRTTPSMASVLGLIDAARA